VSFGELCDKVIEGNLVAFGADGPQAWKGQRMASHRNPSVPFEYQLADGRWMKISERRTQNGGIWDLHRHQRTQTPRSAAARSARPANGDLGGDARHLQLAGRAEAGL
jgi:hypothetical protein